MNIENNDDIQKIALVAIHKKGYTIRIQKTIVELEMDIPVIFFIAEKKGFFFKSGKPIELLGLIELGEIRGENWRLSNEEYKSLFVD
jgi:hypothetical protein